MMLPLNDPTVESLDALATLLGVAVSSAPPGSQRVFAAVVRQLLGEAEPGSARATMYASVLGQVDTQLAVLPNA